MMRRGERHSWQIEQNERGRIVVKNTDCGTRMPGLQSQILYLLIELPLVT